MRVSTAPRTQLQPLTLCASNRIVPSQHAVQCRRRMGGQLRGAAHGRRQRRQAVPAGIRSLQRGLSRPRPSSWMPRTRAPPPLSAPHTPPHTGPHRATLSCVPAGADQHQLLKEWSDKYAPASNYVLPFILADSWNAENKVNVKPHTWVCINHPEDHFRPVLWPPCCGLRPGSSGRPPRRAAPHRSAPHRTKHARECALSGSRRTTRTSRRSWAVRRTASTSSRTSTTRSGAAAAST